jgi:putative oxidoreductase
MRPNLVAEGTATMNATNKADLAALLLRVSLGVMFIAHSFILKYLTFTLAGTAQFFESLGLPAFLAYLTFAAELLGGIALVIGFRTRLVALALVPILLGATWVHIGNGWVFSAANGGWEYPLFLIVVSLASALLGNGAYALDNVLGQAKAKAQPARA